MNYATEIAALKGLKEGMGETEEQRRQQLAKTIGELKYAQDNRMDAVISTDKTEIILIGDKPYFTYRGDDVRVPAIEQTNLQPGGGMLGPQRGWKMTNYFKGQLAEKCGMPKPYFDRLEAKYPTLLKDSVNTLIQEREGKLLRTVGNTAQALLSPQYNTMDNMSAMLIGLEQADNAGAQVWDAQLTDTAFHLKMVMPNRVYNVTPKTSGKDFIGAGGRVGDWMAFGVSLSNSEVGARSLRADVFCLRLSCWNGMVGNNQMRTIHLGRKHDFGIVSQATRNIENEALWSGLRDVVGNVFTDGQTIEKLVARMTKAAETEVTKPLEAIEYIQTRYGMPKAAQDALMTRYLGDRLAGATVWGLSNAVTAMAKDATTQDQRIDLEETGFALLTDERLLKVIV